MSCSELTFSQARACVSEMATRKSCSSVAVLQSHMRMRAPAHLSGSTRAWAVASTSESDALRSEIEWLLQNECKAVVNRIRRLLKDVAISFHEAAALRGAPLRCMPADVSPGSSQLDEEPLLANLMLGASAVHAMRIQVALPKWNRDTPYSAMLAVSQQTTVPLPALVTMQNRVAQATAALGQGHASLPVARSTLQLVMAHLSEAVHAVALASPPADAATTLTSAALPPPPPLAVQQQPPKVPGQAIVAPSSVADAFRDKLQPPPPADLVVDASAAGRPARLYLSATIVRPADGALLDRRIVSAGLDGVEERLRLLDEVRQEAARLLSKLNALAEACDDMA